MKRNGYCQKIKKRIIAAVMIILAAIFAIPFSAYADVGYTFTYGEEQLDVTYDGEMYHFNEQTFPTMEKLQEGIVTAGFSRGIADYVGTADFAEEWEKQEEYYRTLDPHEYLDIPDEGVFRASIDGHDYFFIDGQQVSEEYYYNPENWYDTGSQSYGSFEFNGKQYYYTDGRFVSKQEFDAYRNDPRNWAEIPSRGPGAYSYNGISYYYNDGRYISEEEYNDIIYKQMASEEGCLICGSEKEALKAAREYAGSVFWTDDEGLKLAFYSDDDDPLSELSQTDEGVYDNACEAYLSPCREWTVLDGRFVIMTITMQCTEMHFEGFTKERYLEADARAQEAARLYDHGTDADKVSNVYCYLLENIEYDETGSMGDAYDALIEGKSVCIGYAVAFQMIMEKLGLESCVFTGPAPETDENHAWNAVRIDGELYYVDATFGDTSGDPYRYLLFGTDRREDLYDLGISETSLR